VTETIEVRASRLPDRPVRSIDVPGHVSVLDRDEIEGSPAVTLQDLLAPHSGVLVYDQTGNFVQKLFDLRGFTSGTGTTVYLDGVRLNDPRNNALSLDLVPLGAIERVELIRGSDAAMAGGGSQAGAMHILTRRADGFAGSLAAAGGSLGTSRLEGDIGFASGRFDLLVTGNTERTDGFRVNGTVDREAVTARAGFDAGSGRRVSLTTAWSNTDAGTPGSVTPEELAEDPAQSPYNAVDFLDRGGSMVTLAFDGPVGRDLSVAASIYRREGRTESLTTGRAAAAFGQGFLADLDTTTVGAVGQVTHDRRWARTANRFVAGAEWLDGDTTALGWFVSPDEPGGADSSDPGSNNESGRVTRSVFAEDSFSPTPRWTVVLGLRQDRDEIAYTDRQSSGTPGSTKTYSRLSPRAGVTWKPAVRTAIYVSYGESFLPPTTEQLFAFPGFGSNPDLEPQLSATSEVGWKQTWAEGTDLAVALFRIETENEIVFDPTSTPSDPYGRNVNAGETSRTGIEADARVRLVRGWSLLGAVTFLDATYGDDVRGRKGATIPLVPGATAYLGVDGSLPGRVGLRVEARWVGEQWLEGDERNERRRLGAYTVVNLRVSWVAWVPGVEKRGRAGGRGGVELFAEVGNLLDEAYATRGIWAYDFLAGAESAFLTPAPPRTWLGGVAWKF
jgi:iron complex outermembrane receptor protein